MTPIKIRPLQRVRQSDPTAPSHLKIYKPRYGDNTYLTNDRNFVIRRVGHSWRVQGYVLSFNNGALDKAVAASGIYGVSFERRRDAVEALEHFLEEGK